MTYALLINNSFVNEYNTVEDAVEKAKVIYRRIEWQEKTDLIEVRDVVVKGSYKDVGKQVFYSVDSSKLWRNA